MKYDNKVMFMCGFLGGIVFMLFIMDIMTVDKTAAIAHHAAYYDSVTGYFTWNDEKK